MPNLLRRAAEAAGIDYPALALGHSCRAIAYQVTRSPRFDITRPSPASLPCPLFVVLAPYRSGTNLLIRSLNEVDACTVLSELFNPNGPLFGPPVKTHLNQDPQLTRERNSDPLEFIERRVFTEAQPGIGAVGFKLMYEEARWGRATRVRAWLGHHRSIRIIHLVRENLLEQLVSWRIACRNKQWVIAAEPHPTRPHETVQKPIPTLRLGPAETRRHFRHIEARQAEARRLANTHPFLEITYEGLSSRFAETMSQVQDFLDLPPGPPSPATKKMTTKPPAEIIENHDALKRRMVATRWAGWF